MVVAASALLLLLLLCGLSTAAGFLLPAGFLLARRSDRSTSSSRLRSRTAAGTVSAPQMLLDGWAKSNSFAVRTSKIPARRPDGLDTEVVICGTGIAGLVLAADLERRGVDYLVVEKARWVHAYEIGLEACEGLDKFVCLSERCDTHAPSPRSSPREGGTAVGFWTNAWRCLDNLGISEPLRKVRTKEP